MNQQSTTEHTSVILGSIFTFISVVYSTSRAATTFGEDAIPLMSESHHLQSAVEAGAISTNSLQEGVPEDDEQDGVQYNYSFFHFIFLIGYGTINIDIAIWLC